jgi:hypothetical protein
MAIRIELVRLSRGAREQSPDPVLVAYAGRSVALSM